MCSEAEPGGERATATGCGAWAAVANGRERKYWCHVLVHQAPPHENPLFPTRPVNELSPPNADAETCAGEVSAVWMLAMNTKVYRGLASAGTFGGM